MRRKITITIETSIDEKAWNKEPLNNEYKMRRRLSDSTSYYDDSGNEVKSNIEIKYGELE